MGFIEWKLLDCLDRLVEGLRLVLGKPDPSPVNSVLAKAELVAVEHNPIHAHQREVLALKAPPGQWRTATCHQSLY